MYLSRLILNPRLRSVRSDLADCQAMHRRMMSAFPDKDAETGARAAFGVLYRVENAHAGEIVVLVQSVGEPDWSRLPPGYLLGTRGPADNPACKRVADYYGTIEAGSVLLFRLRANATRKIDTRSDPDGRRRNGRRVELRDEAARIEWLRRKGVQGGFELLSVRAAPAVPNVRSVAEEKLVGHRPVQPAAGQAGDAARLTFGAVLFDGTLKVMDADLFRRTIETGVGPGKAYGLGLLSVARAGR